MIRYELRSIDAWGEPDGGWTWNESYTLARGIEFDSVPSPRQVFARLRHDGYLSDYSKGRVRLEDPNGMGEILEVQNRHTCEPLFALMAEDD